MHEHNTQHLMQITSDLMYKHDTELISTSKTNTLYFIKINIHISISLLGIGPSGSQFARTPLFFQIRSRSRKSDLLCIYSKSNLDMDFSEFGLRKGIYTKLNLDMYFSKFDIGLGRVIYT